jgi:protocatechuate 3,4-dioxygenase beta subunit
MKRGVISISVCVVGILSSLWAQEQAPFPPPPDNLTHRATLVQVREPGEHMIIKGVVYRPDGKTRYGGLVLYLYQTDATGVYNTVDGSWQRPRLHGWLKTDSAGNYTIRTIKPGSYPRGRNPAHIHVTIRYPNGRTRWLDDFLFEGDPFLSETDLRRSENKGIFSQIMKVIRQDDGLLFARRDLVIPQ